MKSEASERGKTISGCSEEKDPGPLPPLRLLVSFPGGCETAAIGRDSSVSAKWPNAAAYWGPWTIVGQRSQTRVGRRRRLCEEHLLHQQLVHKEPLTSEPTLPLAKPSTTYFCMQREHFRTCKSPPPLFFIFFSFN